VNKEHVVLVVCLALAAGVPSAAVSAEDDARGELLFGLCSQCHGADGAGSSLALAPSIAGLSQWYVEAQLAKFKGGVRGAHPEDVAGMRMGPMSRTLLTDEDVRAVASYVAGLSAERPASALSGGDPERGKVIFTICTQCHGPDAAGNPTLNVPPLRYASDWYLLAQLKKFKAGIRGADPTDQFGALMRSMALTLPDEQAMKDVLAYIGTLSEQTRMEKAEVR
jgi:cytochrome c oxidase subunit 2